MDGYFCPCLCVCTASVVVFVIVFFFVFVVREDPRLKFMGGIRSQQDEGHVHSGERANIRPCLCGVQTCILHTQYIILNIMPGVRRDAGESYRPNELISLYTRSGICKTS